jgi:hypothetical protein
MSTYDDASLVLVPSGYKNGVVFSQKPMDANGQLTFTRASSATRVGPNGYIEKVRENLQLYSEDFSNGAYVKQNVTLTASQSDPLGGTGATSFKETTANDLHRFYYTFFAPSVSGYYTNSVYVKDDGRGAVLFGANSIAESFVFTFSTATISNVTGTPFAYSATDAGNGWYRLSITFFASAAFNFCFVQGWNGSTSSYAGDTSKGFFAFGSQLELSDFGPTPYIKTEAAAVSVGPVSGTPRLDYLNGECPSLLLEPQRTNLARQSEQMNNAAWTKSRVTISANAATSPEGYTNADSLIDDSSNASHVIFQGLSPSSTGVITGTIYIKNNNRRFAVLSICTGAGGSIRFSAVVDLQNGVITQNNTLNSPTNTSSSISNAGNGWYRVSVGLNCTTTLAGSNFIVIATSNTGTPTTFGFGTLDPSYIGDGSSVFLWGAQLEEGSYATSYIPTLGASVTRVADAASKTGISSLIGQTEGTLFAEVDVRNFVAFSRIISVSTGISTNRIEILYNTTNRITALVVVDGVEVVFISSAINQPLGAYKIAFAYAQDDFVLYVNGNQIGTDTSGAVPATTRINIGSAFNDGSQLNDRIAQALLFKTRLTNQQLQELTSL